VLATSSAAVGVGVIRDRVNGDNMTELAETGARSPGAAAIEALHPTHVS